MSEPLIGEIRMVGFNFAPRGHALCDGQLLPINQNQALYSILGTTYGGDGRTTFALPDLRGRAPVHAGSKFRQGPVKGAENGTVATNKSSDGTMANSALRELDRDRDGKLSILEIDTDRDQLVSLAEASKAVSALSPSEPGQQKVAGVSSAKGEGGVLPTHAIHFCIALQGVFPSRN